MRADNPIDVVSVLTSSICIEIKYVCVESKYMCDLALACVPSLPPSPPLNLRPRPFATTPLALAHDMHVICPYAQMHTSRVSIVRELHVYGAAVAVHARDTDKLQHQGYGSLLMAAAERVAATEHRSSKVAVISGVGTRHYYRSNK